MPPWGRPLGARTGRNNWGRAAWDETRVEEVDGENDGYGRELVRNGRYKRGMEYGGRGARRRPVDYDDLTDDSESGEGGNYDLYDYGDSTVAYAVQLALRDKEDQLVDNALERIRRAQVLGKNNVRLSQRELEALERKRQQADGSGGTWRPKQSANPAKTSSRPSSRRSAAGFAPDQPPAGYPAFPPDPLSNWARGATATHSRPSSSSSAARPRTPTTQSLRPQQSNSPLRPTYPPYPSERFASNGRPQSMQQPLMYPRPLPDDPHWAPSYYNAMQMGPYGEPLPYPAQLPTDLRVGPQNRMSYPSTVPYQAPPQSRRSSQGTVQSRGDAVPAPAPAPATTGADADESSEESSEESESSEDEDVKIVKVSKVAERPAQPVPVAQRRTVPGATRGGARKRTSR
ncbi:hypothetical protein N7457_009504 [Penicillium paradoxum]|uniref:uncharacterized protein n=1 Tax=Penicillium paradoxum TaxID=176176 RepID=UPI0025493B8B|nr:uncharacterized protein N7457_009504 [Penicillium paradoxum]KAJ5774608.1 hypothetical protein N7457_009504 [Penicillium paradoxum]